MSIENRIISSLNKGFIDNLTNVDEAVRTRFLVNDIKKKQTVLESVQNELKKCNTFTFSIAFITESGLNELKTIFSDLNDKGIRGKIITSNYLYFNSPKIYEELLKIQNVEVRVTESEGFHAKGYLFEQEGYSTLILGSSNLTSHALKINHEWNLKISSLVQGEIISEVKDTITETWNNALPLTEEWINYYRTVYKAPSIEGSNNMIVEDYPTKPVEIIPNNMQVAALRGIEDVRKSGKNKGMLISATGTGKTYLSAFDVRNFKPNRFLFIVHREQILKESIKSFKRILKNNDSEYGMLTGNRKDYNAKYLFTTIQTLSSDDHLLKFARDTFDYIVVDEVHRSGAQTYKKVIEYFKPKFMLGMTATPERTDNINIYELFDYNIAYEIRLQEAIEERLIAPFHYFGVTAYSKDGRDIEEVEDLRYLASDERIDHLIEKMNYYGHSGNKVKGLLFTSRVDEAEAVSNNLNERGYKTSYLTGNNSHDERESAIRKLESGKLDYIVTVDIFNEGIDIPSVNQVIMLRETQSSIIFIQQLGRGLRLHKDKEFATIIDFIGNYRNNYMIPKALSGDSSLNEDVLRKNTIDTSYISGISSVNFEEIAKERIFDSIAVSKLSSIQNLKYEFNNLKNKIGRTPYLKDFYLQKSIDPVILGEKKKSYYTFVMDYDRDFKNIKENHLKETYVKVLELVTRELLNGKRSHESLLLRKLIDLGNISEQQLIDLYISKGLVYTEKTLKSVYAMFNMNYYISSTKNTYAPFEIIKIDEGIISFTKEVREMLGNEVFVRFLNDVIDTSLLINSKYNRNKRFTIGELYTRRDATRLLEWGQDISGTIFGYSIRDGDCPIFVTYHKVDVDESIAYNDGLINTNTFRWYTRNRLTTESEEVKNILLSEERGIELSLFIKKDDSTYEKNFYYLGRMYPIPGSEVNEIMENGQSVVRIDMKLENSLDENFYHYLVD